MQIVEAVLIDVPKITPVFDAYRVFYEQPSDPERAAAFLRDRLSAGESRVFYAIDDAGKPVGFMQLFASFSSVTTCRIWILNDLYVAESLRGSGIGKALLARSVELAKETGARRVVLSTAHTNKRAQRVYERFGFVMDTVFRQYAYNVPL